MATSTSSQEFHYFVQCNEAIQVLCNEAARQCTENVVKNWHSLKQVTLHSTNQKVTLQSCMDPSQCPHEVSVNKRRRQPQHCPVRPPPCQNCIQWCHAIESLYWTDDNPKKDAKVVWENVDPTRLFHDHIEFAKAFVGRFPPGPRPSSFEEFDPTSILILMMNFGKFHQISQVNHCIIEKVYRVQVHLDRERTDDNLRVSLQTRNEYFDHIFDLLDLLESIHPNYLTSAKAADIGDKLQNIQTLPVTKEMEERASATWTSGKKQKFVQHKNEAPSEASRAKSKQQATALQENVREPTTKHGASQNQCVTKKDTAQPVGKPSDHIVQESDLGEIVNLLDYNDFYDLYDALGMHPRDIGNAELDAPVNAVDIKARSVLCVWIKRNGNKATRQALLDALDKCGNIEAKENILNIWNGNEVNKTSDAEMYEVIKTLGSEELLKLYQALGLTQTEVEKAEKRVESSDVHQKARSVIRWWRKVNGKKATIKALIKAVDISASLIPDATKGQVEKWKQQLQRHYRRNKSEIKFGRRSVDVGSMLELFVDLELEEQGGTKTRKLKSYQELFALTVPDKYHILLYGKAGTGKTTQINRIAYDWAIGSEMKMESATPTSIELLFALDIRNLQSNQTLAEAIKRQLIPNASVDDIDQVLVAMGSTCLVLLDGFDEIPKGLSNHALGSPHLDNLFVMVTTRPHMKDHFCRDNKGYTHVQVSGFSKESVSVYIERFFKKSEIDLSLSLFSKIQETPLLQTMSTFPVLLVMICLLWEDTHDRGLSFHSMTTLYSEAVKRYLNKPFDKDEILDGEVVKELLVKAGKTALVELFANNVQIKESTFEGRTVVKDATEIGLVVRAEGKLVDECSVSFIHKTFQEYCAAVYLCSLFRTSQEDFEAYLTRVTYENIDEMEYLMRFSCGLDLQAAEVIFAHVAKLEETRRQWALPIMMLYEIDLTHNTAVCDTRKDRLHDQVPSGQLCNDVKIDRAELLAALHHFGTGEKHTARESWLRVFYTWVSVDCRVLSLQTVMAVLCSMSRLIGARVTIYSPLHEMIPSGNVPDLPISKTIRQFQLFGRYFGHVANSHEAFPECNATSVVSLLSCFPKAVTVTLQAVRLTGQLAQEHVMLSKTVKYFTMSSNSNDFVVHCDATSLVSLLTSMTALKKVTLDCIQLNGQLDGNPPTLSESLKEFEMSARDQYSSEGQLSGNLERYFDDEGSKCSVDITVLVSIFTCMPVLARASLRNVRLTGSGQTDVNSSVQSLKMLSVSNCKGEQGKSLNVNVLANFLGCMPVLTEVTLSDTQLDGEVGGNCVVLSSSLQEFEMKSLSIDKTCTVDLMSLVSLLGCMPELAKVSLTGILIDGDLNESHKSLSESLKEFDLSSKPHGDCTEVHVTQLANLLSCMPALAKVSLNKIELCGELKNKSMNLSRSLKDVKMSADVRKDLRIAAMTLVSLLGCMPVLERLSLEHIELTGELEDNSMPSCQSLEEFSWIRMKSSTSVDDAPVDVMLLARLLQCMPSMVRLSLTGICLTGALDNVPLGQSVEESEQRFRSYCEDHFPSCIPSFTHI